MKAPRLMFAITLLVLQSAVGLSYAQQNPILLKTIAETEVDAKTAQGGVEKKRIALTKAVPGDEVIYTTTFTNQGSKPAGNISVTNPVPANTTYVDGSAFGDNTEITFSIDGGKTYGTPQTLIIKTPEGRERPARPSDYTHIRWVYRGALAPGLTGKAGFRVVVN